MAFFQYSDEVDRTWTYATCDAMWERYLTSGICPGNSDCWLDNSGTVLNQITYLKNRTNKLHNKPLPLGQYGKGTSFPNTEWKNSLSDATVMPEKPFSQPNNVSSTDASEIISTSSTSISLLLPPTALSSVHLFNADKILCNVSRITTVEESPCSVYSPARSHGHAVNADSVQQPVTFLPPISQSLVVVPQCHVVSSDGRKPNIVPPSDQANSKRKIPLLSSHNQSILMPFSNIEKSGAQQQVLFPITYTNSAVQQKDSTTQWKNSTSPKKKLKGQQKGSAFKQKGTISQKPENAQVQTAQQIKNADTNFPVFNLLVPSATSTEKSALSGKVVSTSSVLSSSPAGTAIPPTSVAAIPSVEKTAVPKDKTQTPPIANCNNSCPPDSCSEITVAMEVDTACSSQKTSTSSNKESLTSIVPMDKKQKMLITKSKTNTEVVLERKKENVNKVVLHASQNTERVSGLNKEKNLNSKQENKAFANNSTSVKDIGGSIKRQKHKVATVTTTISGNVSASEESDGEADSADEKDDTDDEKSEESDTDDDDDDARCEVCGEQYNVRRDNKRMGRWIGCEMDCGVWVHRKCVGWTEQMVDTQSYYCDKCQLERLCKLDKSLYVNKPGDVGPAKSTAD